MAWSSWRAEARRGLAATLTVASLAAPGCSLFQPRQPVPVLGGQVLVPPPSAAERRSGSLWRDNVSANYPATDVTARMPGDLLTILILEDDSGSKEAETGTSSESSVFGNLEQFFGLPQQWASHNSNIDPKALLEAQAKRQFDGQGSTSRKGRLKASMTVEVKAVSPTGNLWVAGDKIVAVNNEDQHIVLSGWVRPEDINARNEIDSTRLASARIDYYGSGPVARQQRPGWGTALLDWVWPF